MSEPSRARMSIEEFLRWAPAQDRRHELVDGQPVMMAGASQRHDRIVTNALLAIGNRLRDGGCRPFTADNAVRIPAGNIRYPDLGVDCGMMVDDSLIATEPLLVVEVLSPTTELFDETEKLEEYRSVPSIAHILVVNPERPEARLHSRAGAGWTSARLAGAEAMVDLPALALSFPLGEFYRGIVPRTRPFLVEG